MTASMPHGVTWLAAALLTLGCSCSPYGGGAFVCTSDTQCTPGGICSEGSCAFPDPGCMSGYKYGELSGGKSGACVGDTNPGIDGAIDADNTPTPDGAACYGNGLVHACFAAAPTGNKTLNNMAIDTNGAMCAALVGANANAWCVIAGATVSVQGTVTVIGSRPLVLLSTGLITVPGTLDVASHRGGSQGPAADVAGCNAGTAPTMTSGGAGGSFAGAGGAGAIAGGGTAGTPGGVLTVSTLRGGCPGQAGAGGGGGAAGHGGGAVYLIAGTSITIDGAINASGSSGINANANSSSGGGGGGAGIIKTFPTQALSGAAISPPAT